MKVAYYSPLPPERSGIADYSALLLPALERRVDVTVVKRGGSAPRRVDLHLYHVGNNADAHGWIVDELRRTPGVVVLHDFVLHHLVAGLTLGRGDREGYLSAMYREAGTVGRLLAHGVVDGLVPPLWEVRPADFPLAAAVLDHALGVIVHSHHVEHQVRETGFESPVWHIPMPAWPDAPAPRSDLVPGDGPAVACLGHINLSKRVPVLLQAFARVHRRHPDTRLVLAGSIAPEYELGPLPDGLGDSLVRLDYVDEPTLWGLLAACDLSVNLRHPTMGETSAMVIRALSLGRPVVVSDTGWFAELPDAVAAKVPVDSREAEVLETTLERLLGDEELRSRMSAAARAYAETEHGLERVADLYVAAIEQAAGAADLRTAVLGELARAAHEVGLEPTDAQLHEIGRKAREAGLGG